MTKQWYIIQIIPGNEEKVRIELLKRIQEFKFQDFFGDILIPEAKPVSSFSTLEEKSEMLFPGYMIVSLVPDPEFFRLVKTIPRVIRFLGGESPIPLSTEEVDRIVAQVKGEVKIIKQQEVLFTVGKEVEVISGPFSGFSGIIHNIDDIKQRLVVMVSIFNRLTPVEIMFDQVKM
jgi:transcriptional antiterminator NusG